MQFALVTIGLLMIVTGARDTYAAFGQQLVSDFTGEGNFTYWIAAIGALGALGAYAPLRGFSRAFIALVIVAMVLRNGGVFDKFTEALNMGPIAPSGVAQTGGADTPQTPSTGLKLPTFNAADYTNDATKHFDATITALTNIIPLL